MSEQHIQTGAGSDVVLEACGICKSFPGVKALTDVSITLHRGEVVALLGENGAGKSTLIKVLSGIYQPDAGEIRMDGQTVHFDLPLQARNAGIGVIHQELNYVPTISIAENIFMGKLPKKHGFVDYKTMYAESSRILKKVGLELDPRIQISTCAVAQKQLIEIAKVLSADARVLILDEPTSALNDVETNYLFDLIRRASEAGIAILYISHKLEELFAIADRVVVLRDGCVTGELNIRNTNKNELIARMVGRELTDLFPKTSNPIGDVALEVDHLTTEAFQDVSFKTHRGEIFGIYGLMGSGHQEIGAALFGQIDHSAGSIRVCGKEVRIRQPMDAINNGLAYVPAERKTEGLVLNQSVEVNIASARYSRERPFWLRRKKDAQSAQKWIEQLRIKTPSRDTITESLSGGNQQKVILGKWLELSPDVFILNEPTRGIDVGSKSEIYRILNDLCADGKCVIIITSEMPELLSMSDEIMVMFEGRVSGYLKGSEATQEDVVRLAIGG
ncbi:MAG: sugar ABC transporter ATP-binding protein [Clostridia bacterium]|nr:sugar ABC transporter ATP-binding protein [Clostridia bacterium]